MKKNLKRALALCLALMLALPLLTVAASAASATYPRYTGGSNSIVDGLKAVGAASDSSFSARGKIAVANGIVSSVDQYRGTAAQNTAMLKLLKAGTLKRPGGAAPAVTPAPAQSSSGGSLVSANLGKISFIRQGHLNCKATACAMAVNAIVGANKYSISDMISSGYNCKNLNGYSFKGSDGRAYTTTYKFDTYVGSRNELVGQIETALAHGLPIVVAVHSTRINAPHHWIVVVGKDNSGKYLVLDPSYKGAGTARSCVKTMADLGYDLGITDIRNGPGYGYVSFKQQ